MGALPRSLLCWKTPIQFHGEAVLDSPFWRDPPPHLQTLDCVTLFYASKTEISYEFLPRTLTDLKLVPQAWRPRSQGYFTLPPLLKRLNGSLNQLAMDDCIPTPENGLTHLKMPHRHLTAVTLYFSKDSISKFPEFIPLLPDTVTSINITNSSLDGAWEKMSAAFPSVDRFWPRHLVSIQCWLHRLPKLAQQLLPPSLTSAVVLQLPYRMEAHLLPPNLLNFEMNFYYQECDQLIKLPGDSASKLQRLTISAGGIFYNALPRLPSTLTYLKLESGILTNNKNLLGEPSSPNASHAH